MLSMRFARLRVGFDPAVVGVGGLRSSDLPEVINAILYLAKISCQRRMLVRDFLPLSTVRPYFYAWRDSGLSQTVNPLLAMAARQIEGPEISRSARVIDSQTVRTTESGGPLEYDAGKKIAGRKRLIITDTLGLKLFVTIHVANIQDREGTVDLIKAIRYRLLWLRHLFAEGGYAGTSSSARCMDTGNGRSRSSAAATPRSDSFCSRARVVERTFA